MKFVSEPIDDTIAIVRGEGRLNMVSAPALRQVITGLVDEGRSKIVVDLSGVDFMDSSGLGSLIGCLKTTRQAGGDLRIAAPTKQVVMVLQLSNLDRVLKAYDTPEEAFRDDA
jgi:anti-sigma B factor antagonist